MMLLVNLSLLLISNQSITSDMPQKHRINILKNFFKPSFDEILTVDPNYEKNREYIGRDHELKGWITVTPPNDQCLIIETSPRKKDLKVCKKKDIPFSVSDISGRGIISWKVSTGPSDFGTIVTWQTPYRVGSIVDGNMVWPGFSRDILIKGCKARVDSHYKKIIDIVFFNNKTWSVQIPKNQKYINQPLQEKPNLYVQQEQASSSLQKLRSKKKRENKNKHIDENAVSLDIDEHANFIKFNWQTHPRDAFYLPPDNLQLNDSSPTGKQGICLYKNYGFKHDPLLGILECQNVGHIKWLYLPLSCINDEL